MRRIFLLNVAVLLVVSCSSGSGSKTDFDDTLLTDGDVQTDLIDDDKDQTPNPDIDKQDADLNSDNSLPDDNDLISDNDIFYDNDAADDVDVAIDNKLETDEAVDDGAITPPDQDNITDAVPTDPDVTVDYDVMTEEPDETSETGLTDSDTQITDNDQPANDSDNDSSVIVYSWKSLALGDNHMCGILSANNKLYCWGSNYTGQLGDGTSCSEDPNTCADKWVPTKIGDENWKKVSAGTAFTCAIKEIDSKLYCWGSNWMSQLGDGTTVRKLVPTEISDDEWSDVVAGDGHACALKLDNTLYCWGWNDNGQLGLGDRTIRKTPTKIGNYNWEFVSLKAVHSCAIKADNTLHCWGSNREGEIGDGTDNSGCISWPPYCEDKIEPVQITTDSWLSVMAGEYSTCGIKQVDNKLYCWGGNDLGQFGDGTSNSTLVPQKTSDEIWKKVDVGYYHACGIKMSDSKLYCWGDNEFGAIGDDTVTLYDEYGIVGPDNNKHVPTKIGNDVWNSIVTGSGVTCGIKATDNELYCWGHNKNGQLGDGTTVDRHVPTLVVEP